MVGFVGLGQMGQPIAKRLLQALEGVPLRVCDLHAERALPLVACGALRAERLAEVGEPGGVVFTMVATDEELLQVALGEEGILHQLGSGGIHVSLSTVSPEVSTQLERRYRQQGCTYLVATVLGRPDVVEEGNLALFLAGEPQAKKRVQPLLKRLGTYLYDLGNHVEAANIAKMASNFLISSAIEAMGEVAALVDAHGLDRQRFFQMLVASPLFRCAVYEGYGALMIGPRNFSDNRFPVALGLKDLNLLLQAGRDKHLHLPCAEAAYQHLLAAQAAGRGNEDWSVLSEFAGSCLTERLSPGNGEEKTA